MKILILILSTVLVLMISGCGDTGRQAELANLVNESEHYHGDVVQTEGVVRMHPQPLHYWIEDSALNRVRLEPGEVIADLVDQRVQVQGRFTYTPEQGRAIQINDINGL